MLVYVDRNALNYAPQVVRERKESNRVVIKAERLRRRLFSGCGEMERPSRIEDIGLDIQARGTKMILADGWWELDSDAEAISPQSCG
ncbi:unnamed protein product [Malus baccata var. baccata]